MLIPFLLCGREEEATGVLYYSHPSSYHLIDHHLMAGTIPVLHHTEEAVVGSEIEGEGKQQEEDEKEREGEGWKDLP